MKANIALVDDHVMLRNGLATLLRDNGYNVVLEASNGKGFIEGLRAEAVPHLVLMDITMPVMDGYETTAWLKANHPAVKVLALTMHDDDVPIIRMLRSGAKGYLLKESEPAELMAAIETVLTKGFYHSDLVSGKLVEAISGSSAAAKPTPKGPPKLSDKESEYLQWACTDLSSKEIAVRMGVSPRTVDGYRDALQFKLDCKGRIGLALWALKNGVVEL